MWDNLFNENSTPIFKLFFSFVSQTFNFQGADLSQRESESEKRKTERMKVRVKVRAGVLMCVNISDQCIDA